MDTERDQDSAVDQSREPLADDDSVRDQERQAAAEAAAIGGGLPEGDEDADPALRPVVEGGGGESEGFELAEEELRAHAEHDADYRSPAQDAMTPEVESDRSSASYGDADGREAPEPDLDRDRDPSESDRQ